MTEDQERAIFEAAITASPFEREIYRFPNDATRYAWPGSYRDLAVDLAWYMWQARAGVAEQIQQKELTP